MPDDDDDIKFTEHPDGSYEWEDSSGTHGSVSRSGAQVFNPDGSGTAMDTKGNETHWDADGDFDEGKLGTDGTGANIQVGDGSDDGSYDPYADLPSDATGAGISASDDNTDTAYEDASAWDPGGDSNDDDSY